MKTLSQVLAFVAAVTIPLGGVGHASAATGPSWVALSDLAVPDDALRLHGNIAAPEPAARAVWEGGAASKTSKWANPVLCRVKYGRTFLPGELDAEEGICVLFKYTRHGLNEGCTSRDSVCRVHVPPGEHIQVFVGAASMHLIPLVAGGVLPKGIASLEGEALDGASTLCVKGGHPGTVEQKTRTCVSPTVKDPAAATFVYGDVAATQQKDFDALAAYLREVKEPFRARFMAAGEAQTLDEVEAELKEMAQVRADHDKRLAQLMADLSGAMRTKAEALVATETGELFALQARIAKELSAVRDTERRRAEFLALATRVQGELTAARSFRGDTAQATTLVGSLERSLVAVQAALDTEGLPDAIRALGNSRLAPLLERIREAVRILEPGLGAEDRMARFEAVLKPLRGAGFRLPLVRQAVAAFRRLVGPDGPLLAQIEMLKVLDRFRTKALHELERARVRDADCMGEASDPESDVETTCDRDRDAAKAAQRRGYETLPRTPGQEAADTDGRRMVTLLGEAGITWDWAPAEVPPSWDAAWTDPERPRRIHGPALSRSVEWLHAQAVGHAAPEIAHWAACVGPSAVGVAVEPEVRFQRCVDAEDGMGMLSDSSHREGREAVEAMIQTVRTEVITSVVSAGKAVCERMLKRYEDYLWAMDLEEACEASIEAAGPEAEVDEKEVRRAEAKRGREQVKLARAQRGLVKLYQKFQKALGGKAKKARKHLDAIRKKNPGHQHIERKHIEAWTKTLRAAERREAEASGEKGRKKALKKADKLARKLPKHASACQKARDEYKHATVMGKKATERGDAKRAKKLVKVREKMRKRACKAQAAVQLVSRLYEDYGRPEAALAAEEAAQSCLERWRCD